MTLTEALGIVNRHRKSNQPTYRLVAACGFTPLHWQTFLTAHLQVMLPEKRVETHAGLFGDLGGTLERLAEFAADAVAVALEWADLDSRLDPRSLGSWSRGDLDDIEHQVRQRLEILGAGLRRRPTGCTVVLSLPTLPLPAFVFPPATWQASPASLRLESAVTDFAAKLEGVQVLSRTYLDRISPLEQRREPRKELETGFPYTMPHAEALARSLSRMLAPAPPKKGLITDLDDTLWRGLAGEVGPAGVTWDLASHSQEHGLYQKLLCSLAEHGVLLAVASKNDAAIVDETFARPDILLPADRIYPIEAHWGAKSESVGRILARWNIAADATVFIDDNPRELEEVKRSHPDLECIQFPTNDPGAVLRLLDELRDRFGKPGFHAEDTMRLESIRRHAELAEASPGGQNLDELLRQANAVLSLDFDDAADQRVLELVNKTNQFNLNGRRYTAAEWTRQYQDPQALTLVASYRDKFGPLGKIAVLTGKRDAPADTFRVDTWVMSCRAFSRRIEWACLRTLFERLALERIVFSFVATPRNGPLRQFLATLGVTEDTPELTRSMFHDRCPPLDHRIEA